MAYYLDMASPIFASSPGIVVTQADFAAAAPAGPVVLLSFSSTIADKIVITDISGLASPITPITVSTVYGVSYVRDISTITISSIQISEPGGSMAVSATTPFVYTVLNSRAFPKIRAPLAIKPSYELISTVSTYTLDVLSSLSVQSINPLINFTIINPTTFTAEFTSTVANTLTASALYGGNVGGNYYYHSTASASTLRLNASNFVTGSAHDSSGATIGGHVQVGGAASIAGHYSTVAGSLLAPAVNFSAGSNVTVVGRYSTLSNFYSAGSIDIRDGFTIGGYISTGQMAAGLGATHGSTLWVSSALTVGTNLVVGPGSAYTSTIVSGSGSAAAYAFDNSGAFVATGAFIDAGTYSTVRVSTSALVASTLQVGNGSGAFKYLFTSNTPSKLYYDGVEVGGGSAAVSQILVSTFVSTPNLYVSSFYAGGSNYRTPYQFDVNGGMRISNPTATRYYVAGGSNNTTTGIGTLKWSTDGLTWNNNVTGGFGNSTAGGSGQGVAWNGRQWVAVGHSDLGQKSTIQTSMDGSNWTAAVSGGFGPDTGSTTLTDGHGVAWNGSLWVAVGSYGDDVNPLNSILYSGDGSNWSNAASGGFQGSGSTGATGFEVVWNGRIWLALGRDSTDAARIQYSTNGSNWSNSTSGAFTGTGNFGRGAAWNGNYWVAVGKDTTAANNIKYSYDGSNWSNSASGAFNTDGASVCWNGQVWFATGRDTTATANTIKYSYDGRNWSNITSGGFSNSATTGGAHIAFDGVKWLAGGFGTTITSNMKYSYNGLNWSDASGSFATAGFVAAYGADLNPALKINNLDFYTQGINPYLTSTNTIFSQVTPFNRLLTHSTSMVLNNTLYVNPPGGVSINIERAISSANVALYVYGSTFTNNPNPIKVGGGSWTSISDSNWKDEIYEETEKIMSTSVSYMTSIKPKEFNYKKSLVYCYTNMAGIERRNMVVQTKGKEHSCLEHDPSTLCLLKRITDDDTVTSYSGDFEEIDYAHRVRELGFLTDDILPHVPGAIEKMKYKGVTYDALNYDQINMIHLAATHHLMSTIECQVSTIQGQEEMIARILRNFDRLGAMV